MIYLLEDDNNIRELVVYTLNSSGYTASGFAHPREFWAAMEEEIPSLVLLDIMLPDEDGISILKKLREAKHTQGLPVMMLTAKGSEYDKVIGLDSGADDYLPKPFGMMELISRVKALLRRTSSERAAGEFTMGCLYVCPAKHKVRVNGEKINLTLKEFELLCALIESRDVVLTRNQLLDRVWGYSFDGGSRTVDVHVRTLRQKLGEAGDLIVTVRGIGYKMGGGENE